MSIGLWAQVAVLIIDCYIGLFGTGFVYVLCLGRAPRTRETLPDFHEKCLVTRHSRVFRGLTGSQRTPGFWGVTALDSLLICSVVCIKGYPRNFIGMLLWVVRVVICNDFVRKHFLNYFQSLVFILVEDAS